MASGRHFLHVFPSFDPGGMEVRAAMVMDRLPRPDRHTVVAMSGRTGCAARVRQADLTLLAAPPKGSFLATARAMAARIRELRPDLVLTYNWGAIETVLGCRLAGQRALIHHEEGFGVDETERLLRRRVWMRRWLLRGAAAVVVPSRGLAGVARARWKVSASKLHHLQNGVDLSRFAGVPRAPRAPVVVGAVAHFRPEKDVPALVEAFSRCAHRGQAELLLVGDGVERARAEALARERGIPERVRFAGAVQDTAPLYAQMDVFALSSRTEQMPLVVLEAMAAALPIAAPAVGDVAAMVADANRPLICAPRDPTALAASLDQLLADAALRQRLGAANRARCVAEFELGARLDAHLQLYRQTLAAV